MIALLVFMASDGGRRGYRHLLDAFWDQARRHGIALPLDQPVSAAAFCNARKRLLPAAMRQVLRDISGGFESRHGPRHRLHGRRVLAVDGSKFNVQRSAELWQAFGGPTNGHVPQLTVAVLFDVIAKMPVDAVISPYGVDERAQLAELLSSTREGATSSSSIGGIPATS